MTTWTLEAPVSVLHRKPWEPGAGEWVAYRDEPARRYNPVTRKFEPAPGTQRSYLYDLDRRVTATAGTATATSADRFSTKADAMEAARQHWGTYVKGCRLGAERIPP
jgi:hypothetical protein